MRIKVSFFLILLFASTSLLGQNDFDIKVSSLDRVRTEDVDRIDKVFKMMRLYKDAIQKLGAKVSARELIGNDEWKTAWHVKSLKDPQREKCYVINLDDLNLSGQDPSTYTKEPDVYRRTIYNRCQRYFTNGPIIGLQSRCKSDVNENGRRSISTLYSKGECQFTILPKEFYGIVVSGDRILFGNIKYTLGYIEKSYKKRGLAGLLPGKNSRDVYWIPFTFFYGQADDSSVGFQNNPLVVFPDGSFQFENVRILSDNKYANLVYKRKIRWNEGATYDPYAMIINDCEVEEGYISYDTYPSIRFSSSSNTKTVLKNDECQSLVACEGASSIEAIVNSYGNKGLERLFDENLISYSSMKSLVEHDRFILKYQEYSVGLNKFKDAQSWKEYDKIDFVVECLSLREAVESYSKEESIIPQLRNGNEAVYRVSFFDSTKGYVDIFFIETSRSKFEIFQIPVFLN